MHLNLHGLVKLGVIADAYAFFLSREQARPHESNVCEKWVILLYTVKRT